MKYIVAYKGNTSKFDDFQRALNDYRVKNADSLSAVIRGNARIIDSKEFIVISYSNGKSSNSQHITRESAMDKAMESVIVGRRVEVLRASGNGEVRSVEFESFAMDV